MLPPSELLEDSAHAGEGGGPLGASPPARGRRHRSGLPRLRAPERGDRPQRLGSARLRVPGARCGQRRDPPPVRHGGAEGALAAPARRGRDPVVLLDDRARGVRLRPDDAPDARGARRRRVGDRRPQVVLVGRRGRRVRDRDGGHRSRRGAAPAREPDHRPGRHAGRRDRPPGLGLRAPGARLDDPLRGALHGRAGAGRERPRRAGRRLSDRPEAARAGPDPPRHALARPDAARLRAHVHAARSSGKRSARASPTSRRSRTGSPTRRPRSRPAG